jgi:hypothetical protein
MTESAASAAVHVLVVGEIIKQVRVRYLVVRVERKYKNKYE